MNVNPKRPPQHWWCGACAKKQTEQSGSGYRFVLGLRVRVCKGCVK